MDTKTSDQNQRRSRKQEHVINNAVLYVYKDIINDLIFIVKSFRGLDSVRVLEDLTKIPKCNSIYKDYHNTFPEHIIVNIQDRMLAHIADTAAYYNRNSETYGRSIVAIRKAAKKYMKFKYQGNLYEAQRYASQIGREVHEMNSRMFYVDQEALNYWRNYEGDSMEIFGECIDYVHEMFMNLPHRLDQWIQQISISYPFPNHSHDTKLSESENK